MSTTTILNCASVAALPDDTWLNGQFNAIVLKIEPINKKAGGVFYKASLGDAPGDYTHGVTMSLFQPPKFQAGDAIQISGKGAKKSSYQGKPQISTGKDTLIGVSVGHQRVEAAAQSAVAAQQAASDLIPGQTVGMAMKEALSLHSRDVSHEKLMESLSAPGWWSAVYATASDIIRVARLLEHGKLVDPVSRRGTPTKAAPKPAPQHDPERELNAAVDEDVPF